MIHSCLPHKSPWAATCDRLPNVCSSSVRVLSPFPPARLETRDCMPIYAYRALVKRPTIVQCRIGGRNDVNIIIIIVDALRTNRVMNEEGWRGELTPAVGDRGRSVRLSGAKSGAVPRWLTVGAARVNSCHGYQLASELGSCRRRLLRTKSAAKRLISDFMSRNDGHQGRRTWSSASRKNANEYSSSISRWIYSPTP